MIADLPFIEALILKLGILDRYPKTDAGIKALVDAMSEADNRVQAEQFIDGWIRHNKKCPMPCDIYEGLGGPPKSNKRYDGFPAIPKGKPAPPPEYMCDQCQDSGWYMVLTKKEIPDLPGQYYTAAKRCPHPPQYRGAMADKIPPVSEKKILRMVPREADVS